MFGELTRVDTAVVVLCADMSGVVVVLLFFSCAL